MASGGRAWGAARSRAGRVHLGVSRTRVPEAGAGKTLEALCTMMRRACCSSRREGFPHLNVLQRHKTSCGKSSGEAGETRNSPLDPQWGRPAVRSFCPLIKKQTKIGILSSSGPKVDMQNSGAVGSFFHARKPRPWRKWTPTPVQR